MNKNIFNIEPLDLHWNVVDPFLFCAHHKDHYPPGNNAMGASTSLSGRNLGQDFILKDGFRMYHGMTIPGFPEHPHRGFETVTIVLEGFVDHSDSWGQAGRYGMGDVQWMTAGSGLQHAEMFPILNNDRDNPAELFQVWLNLPARKKMVKPHYKMLWAEHIPVITKTDDNGRKTFVRVIAGNFEGSAALPPAPDSYASEKESDVAIWIIRMEKLAKCTLSASNPGSRRKLFYYQGNSMNIAGSEITAGNGFEVNPDLSLILQNGDTESCLLLLQGKPLGEKVVQYGPFVMNSDAEIRQTFADYRETQFGGWPWERSDMVHPRDSGRFAKFIDGTVEKP